MTGPSISIGTTFNYDIPLKEQLPMIKKAGFTHISLGAGDLEHSGYLTAEGQRNVKELTQDTGLDICSIHAPFFGEGTDVSAFDKNEAAISLDILKKCIDAAIYLQAGVITVHPCPMKIERLEVRKDVIVKQVRNLIDHIGKETVKIAIENLPSIYANTILDHSLKNINDVHYGFCFDSSHDNLMERRFDMLIKYADRLITTHISDNRGQKDDHMLPFEGSYPWDEFCRVFKQIDYKGVLLLEVEMRESAFKTPSEFLTEAYARGVRLLQ